MKLFTIRSVCILLLSACTAHENSLDTKTMRPSQWLSPLQLEQMPSFEEISFEKLEKMSVEKGAELVEQIYHLSQINHSLRPNFVPSPSTTPVYFYRPSGQKVTTALDKMAILSTQLPEFGENEVTIFITGVPGTTETVRKANNQLIEAYLQRYSIKTRKPQKNNSSGEKIVRTSSEEDSREWQIHEHSTGNLMVIDLGAKLNNFKRMASLDTEQTGAMIASTIMKMTDKTDVAVENIHIIAQGIAAHVAGAAGNEYYRRAGRKLRRITALDPSKLYTKDPDSLTGLTRGDAEFVDAIHTSVYGLGTIHRVGNVDFYPSGPSHTVYGARNIIEASMRATRYFAETVRPGHERNFVAFAVTSLKEFSNNNSYGRRVHMGIDTDFDVEGDYILEVNEHSPFGKRTHKPWKFDQDTE